MNPIDPNEAARLVQRAEQGQARYESDMDGDIAEQLAELDALRQRCERAEAGAAAMREALAEAVYKLDHPTYTVEDIRRLQAVSLATDAGKALLERVRRAEQYKDEIVASAQQAKEKVRELERKLAIVKMPIGDVWAWQGDEDELREHDGCSLICPVVAEVDTIRVLVDERDAARAEVECMTKDAEGWQEKADAARDEAEALKQQVKDCELYVLEMAKALHAERDAVLAEFEVYRNEREPYYRKCAEAAQAEVVRLKESMTKHFAEEHLAGDGPEIDRWKARVKELESEVTQLEAECQRAFRAGHQVTLNCQTLEEMTAHLVELVRKARDERDAARAEVEELRRTRTP